jgi:hypothetical protein
LDVDLDLAHAVLHGALAAPSAARAAAYGVLLREPLNPAMPAEPHATTFPV